MRKTAFLVVAVFLILGVAAMAANQFGVADKRNVTFHDPVMIGDTLLPAGEYQVVHQMQGNDHIMVFTKTTAKHVEARVKCTLQPLAAPAPRTEVHFRINDNKQHVLSGLIFKGDRAEHAFF